MAIHHPTAQAIGHDYVTPEIVQSWEACGESSIESALGAAQQLEAERKQAQARVRRLEGALQELVDAVPWENFADGSRVDLAGDEAEAVLRAARQCNKLGGKVTDLLSSMSSRVERSHER